MNSFIVSQKGSISREKNIASEVEIKELSLSKSTQTQWNRERVRSYKRYIIRITKTIIIRDWFQGSSLTKFSHTLYAAAAGKKHSRVSTTSRLTRPLVTSEVSNKEII